MYQPDIAPGNDRFVGPCGCQLGWRRCQQRWLDLARVHVDGHVHGAALTRRLASDLVKRLVGLVDHRVWAVPCSGGIAGNIARVEQVRLAAARASHPLPAEVVTGKITVKQVGVQPVCGHAPMHLADMHDIAGQPHACMVVQVTRFVKRAHSHVDDWHASCAFADVGRQQPGIAGLRQQPLVQAVKDVRATKLPDVPEVLAPAQLINKLVLGIQRVFSCHAGEHFRQADKAVRDVGGQAGHRALQCIAAARVVTRMHSANARQCSLARWHEVFKRIHVAPIYAGSQVSCIGFSDLTSQGNSTACEESALRVSHAGFKF